MSKGVWHCTLEMWVLHLNSGENGEVLQLLAMRECRIYTVACRATFGHYVKGEAQISPLFW